MISLGLPSTTTDCPTTSRRAAELPLPVPVAQHHAFRRARRIVGGVEAAAEHRLHAQRRQDRVADHQRIHLLGLAAAGDRDRRGVPEADVLEDAVLLAVGEVSGRPLVQQRDVHARRLMPHADQPLGLVERQGLEQDRVDDAEDRGVGPDADGQRHDGDGGEQRRAHERMGDAANPGNERRHVAPFERGGSASSRAGGETSLGGVYERGGRGVQSPEGPCGGSARQPSPDGLPSRSNPEGDCRRVRGAE